MLNPKSQSLLALLCHRLRVAPTRLVVDHSGTAWNVSFCSLLIESSITMWALDVIWIFRGRRRWQVTQFAAACQMCLHLLCGPDGLDEFLMFLTPVALLNSCGKTLLLCRTAVCGL